VKKIINFIIYLFLFTQIYAQTISTDGGSIETTVSLSDRTDIYFNIGEENEVGIYFQVFESLENLKAGIVLDGKGIKFDVAVENSLIKYEINGYGSTKKLKLNITNESNFGLRLKIKPGTVFIPNNSSTQKMVVWKPITVDLEPYVEIVNPQLNLETKIEKERIKSFYQTFININVACMDIGKNPPGKESMSCELDYRLELNDKFVLIEEYFDSTYEHPEIFRDFFFQKMVWINEGATKADFVTLYYNSFLPSMDYVNTLYDLSTYFLDTSINQNEKFYEYKIDFATIIEIEYFAIIELLHFYDKVYTTEASSYLLDFPQYYILITKGL